MIILTPKLTFLGGALVSASHLGRLFPGKLYTWGLQSQFLDVNQVQYTPLDTELTKTKDDLSNDDDISIWCNDTCVDEGYYPNVLDKNKKLWEFISSYKRVYLCNHQPISRCIDYLDQMLSYLMMNQCEVILLNYRACWNDEFNFYFGLKYPNIRCYTTPYHYYLKQCGLNSVNSHPGEVWVGSVGRTNSKCKIQSQHKIIEFKLHEAGWKYNMIEPDHNCPNDAFLQGLGEYDYILTGYYYGGEGNPELDVPYNKLEWSFMDALLAGCIPATSSLFSKELERLGISAPVIDYNFMDIDEIYSILASPPMNVIDARDRLIRELNIGNEITKRIIEQI